MKVCFLCADLPKDASLHVLFHTSPEKKEKMYFEYNGTPSPMIKCNEETIEYNDLLARDSYISKSIELHLLAVMSPQPTYGWQWLNQLAGWKNYEECITKTSKRANLFCQAF